MVEAAATAGVEVRQGFTVEELVTDGERVVGVRGRSRGTGTVSETARLVVGADGKHSVVAKAVGPAAYHEKPALSMGYYTYWADVPIAGGEMYGREDRLVGAWPTNDGLVITYVAAPVAQFHAFRSDIEGNVLASLDQCGDLGERVRAGKRADRFFGTADLPNRFHKPFGLGWALVGDAGLVMDPITGQGIGHAFRDAELLTEAIDAGFAGRQPLMDALAGYERQRNDMTLPMYGFTTELASFAPPMEEQLGLFRALVGRPAEIDRFLGVLTGTVPIPEYFAPGNLIKVIGIGGMARIAWGKMRSRRSRTSAVHLSRAEVKTLRPS
jgi:2-polyprenyl-6-methoxyphenol hydroxylase-like FAD-dependent oxidoreductase